MHFAFHLKMKCQRHYVYNNINSAVIIAVYTGNDSFRCKTFSSENFFAHLFNGFFFLNDIMSGLTIRSPKLSHAD